MAGSFVFKRGGVFIAPELCEPVWRALRNELIRTHGVGGMMRPGVEQLINDLREATSDHLLQVPMSEAGHVKRSFTDIEPPSTMTTEALANELRVGDRQARRIATAEGVDPIAKNTWLRTDVAALVARRRHAA